MIAISGKDILLKLDEVGDGSYVSVAGLRSTSIACNASVIDITSASSAGHWRELLSGGGVKSITVTGAGIFRNDEADEKIRSIFFTGTLCSWMLVIPDFGSLQGPFQVSSLEYSGSYESVATYDMALSSAGEIVFNV